MKFIPWFLEQSYVESFNHRYWLFGPDRFFDILLDHDRAKNYSCSPFPFPPPPFSFFVKMGGNYGQKCIVQFVTHQLISDQKYANRKAIAKNSTESMQKMYDIDKLWRK